MNRLRASEKARARSKHDILDNNGWEIPGNVGSSTEPLSENSDPSTGWQEVQAQLRSADETMVEGYKDELDTLLVFAGLFSAVLTAFVVESYTSLIPDPSQPTVQLLYRISLQLPNTSELPTLVPPSPSSGFRPAQSDVWVNALWFTSLVIALISALVAILVKQWAREYLSWTSVSPGRDAVALRQYRYEAWTHWNVQRWRDVVATLLQLGLLLFFVGLVILLWNLNRAIAGLVTAAAGVGLGCLLVSVVLPVFYSSCPYRTPLSWAFRRVSQTIFGLPTPWIRPSERPGNYSWVQQDVKMTTERDVDIDEIALNGVLGILRALPSGKTLDTVSPCLYRMPPWQRSHWQRIHYVSLSALWATIAALMDENLPPLPEFNESSANRLRIAMLCLPPDHAWTITKLARFALLKQPYATLVSNAIGLVDFITLLVKYQFDEVLSDYHLGTLMRLLSSAPEPLAKAALKNLEPTMRGSSGSISIIESKDFFEDMHSVLTEETSYLFRERGWLLAPCTVLMGLIKQLHDVKSEAVLATDLADLGSRLLPLIEKHLIIEFQDTSESQGVFDLEWLAKLVRHISEFPKLVGRLSESNSTLPPWRRAQLSTIFSIGCHLTRLIYQRCQTLSNGRGLAWQYVILVAGTLRLATVLVRLKSRPEGELLKPLLELIHDNHMLGNHMDDAYISLELYELLRDFFVAFYNSNDPKNIEADRPPDDEAVIPRLLLQFMIHHWNVPPFKVPKRNAWDQAMDSLEQTRLQDFRLKFDQWRLPRPRGRRLHGISRMPQSSSAPQAVESRAVDSADMDSFATQPHTADSATTHPPVMRSPTTDTTNLKLSAQESLTMDPLDTNLSAKDSCTVDLPIGASHVAARPVAGHPAACSCTACSPTSNRPIVDASASGLTADQRVLAADANLQRPLHG